MIKSFLYDYDEESGLDNSRKTVEENLLEEMKENLQDGILSDFIAELQTEYLSTENLKNKEWLYPVPNLNYLYIMKKYVKAEYEKMLKTNMLDDSSLPEKIFKDLQVLGTIFVEIEKELAI